ncbi:MAG: cytochrome c3 family protein [Nitrospirota bacterium]
MNKNFFILFFSVILLGTLSIIPYTQSSHELRHGYSFNDVHIWPGSKCSICHFFPYPDAESSRLKNKDQSRLCESCHKGTVTIISANILKSEIVNMNNHPIKVSPLEFDPERFNHNIIREGRLFYVSGESGRVPLFGDTRESAVIECGTCHDAHGRSGADKLPIIDNTKNQLCLACHINIKS